MNKGWRSLGAFDAPSKINLLKIKNSSYTAYH